MRSALQCVAALAFAASGAVAQPASQPISSASPHQAEASGPDAKASEPKPLASKSQPALAPPQAASAQQATKSTDHSGSASSAHSEKSWSDQWLDKFRDDPIVAFTLVLAVSTIFLWLDTRGLRRAAQGQSKDTREALDIAKEAAGATKDSVGLARAAFFAAHRPRIAIRRLEFKLSRGIPVALKFSLHNIGDSGAVITEKSAHIQIMNHPEEDPRTKLDYAATEPVIATEIKGGGWIDMHIPIVYTEALELAFPYGFGSEMNPVYAVGYVLYSDGSSVVRRTSFLRRYDHDLRLFKPHEDRDYENQD